MISAMYAPLNPYNNHTREMFGFRSASFSVTFCVCVRVLLNRPPGRQPAPPARANRRVQETVRVRRSPEAQLRGGGGPRTLAPSSGVLSVLCAPVFISRGGFSAVLGAEWGGAHGKRVTDICHNTTHAYTTQSFHSIKTSTVPWNKPSFAMHR